MNKRKYIKWGLDFVFLTALAIILSQQMWSRYWVAVPIICILTLKVFEYMAAVAEKHLRVRAQLSLLMTLTPFEDVHGLRCTYHVPIWRKRFVQTCDYIPTGGGGRRKFSRTKGIIGAAFEEKKVLVENFSSDEEYRRQMVQKYNYT